MGLVPYGNTAEAFEKAIELKSPMVEFDVRRLGDGTLVVYHDAQLGAAPLSRLDWPQFSAATRHLGFPALTLHETLVLCKGRTSVDVELKEVGYEDQVVHCVRSVFTPDEAILKSFHEPAVRALRARAPGFRVGLLLGDTICSASDVWRALRPEAAVRRTQPHFVSPGRHLLRYGMLARLQRLNLPIYVWTVDDPAEMRALASAGVAALITNRPDLALEIVA